ncbi:MAG TPA: alginate export family protein [Bryobacteraceae bacterium]|jgi:Alginate export|nr:alginate export family protein [Bryobacteraceae bacterium]
MPRLHDSRLLTASTLLFLFGGSLPVFAQDDVTTQNGASGYNGAFITGPASNPLSFLNGPAFRTTGQSASYDFPDFAPMSKLDEELPSWIGFGLEERLRWEGMENQGFKPVDDNYLLNRWRFLMQIKPTSWLRFVGQMQDARAWYQMPPLQPPNTNRFDLKLAYAEFGDPEHQWISVRVGRQLINYNNTIIANSEWRDQGRSYDAVVTNLHIDRVHLGIFAASAVVPLDEGISHHQEGNNIYGMYGGIDNLILPTSSFEPFVLWRVDTSVATEPDAISKAKTGHESEQAYGIRWKGLAFNNFDYSIEGIREGGTDGTNNIQAWGTTDGLAYRFSQMYWRPRVFSQYDYASGDKNSKDGIHGTFDTMYPTAHDRFGISDQFGWENIKAVRAGVTIEPHRRWTVTGQWLDFWLASATDSLYNTSGGSIVRNTAGTAGTHIGNELDAYTWYEINRHVNFGFGVAHIFPGQYLNMMTKGPNFTYPYFALNFKDAGSTH